MERVTSPAGLPPERWSVETVLGKPALATVAYARKHRADLIVMGTNSRRGPAKLFFGSTAEGVLRRAPAAVLVVPQGRPERVDWGHPARPIVGAIDLGPQATGDTKRMLRVAKQLGAPLTLLHVVSQTPAPSWFATRLNAHDRKRLLAARARLRSIAGTVKSSSRVLLGHPADEIVATALDAQAGLIVLTLRRGHGLFGARQGTTTYRVLCGSRTPVLALAPAASGAAGN
jgi:nucleotide-binding universal stress UspA family protein